MKFTDTYGGRPDKGEKQMKKILTLLLMFVLLAFSTTVFAGWNDRDIVERIRAVGNTPSAQKKADRIFLEQAKMSPGFRRPVVAIVYENNAKTKYDKAIDKKLFEYLDAALPMRTYELVDGRMIQKDKKDYGCHCCTGRQWCGLFPVSGRNSCTGER